MKMNTLLAAAILGPLAMALTGCVVTGTVHERYYEPRPVYAEPASGVIIVRREPPPVIVERPAPFPGGEVIWVPGYYTPRGDDWFWVPGHYEAPPRRGAVWVAPRYERRGTEVHFSVGTWR